MAGFYSSTGRPSVDPELMIRMLLIGYCVGIRPERRLCEEVHLNLAYRWFCRLGLEGKVPDHSTFSKNRHGRFRESGLLRHLFETVVQRCMNEGLVGGEGFAVDASLIQADANKQRSLTGSDWHAQDHTEAAPRAVREYLATLDVAAWGAATDVDPKFVSPSDPAAQWTSALRGPAFFAYADNYLIDLQAAVIVDVEASRAVRQAEAPACERWGQVLTGSGCAVVWPRFAPRWLVPRFRSCCPRTPRSCTFTAVLSRQPQAVSLADHCISGDAPSELLRNRAGRLPGDPQALQQLHSWLIPVDRHAEPLNLFAPYVLSQGGQLAGSVTPLSPNQLLILAKKGVSETEVGVVARAWTASILVLTTSGA